MPFFFCISIDIMVGFVEYWTVTTGWKDCREAWCLKSMAYLCKVVLFRARLGEVLKNYVVSLPQMSSSYHGMIHDWLVTSVDSACRRRNEAWEGRHLVQSTL